MLLQACLEYQFGIGFGISPLKIRGARRDCEDQRGMYLAELPKSAG